MISTFTATLTIGPSTLKESRCIMSPCMMAMGATKLKLSPISWTSERATCITAAGELSRWHRKRDLAADFTIQGFFIERRRESVHTATTIQVLRGVAVACMPKIHATAMQAAAL